MVVSLIGSRCEACSDVRVDQQAVESPVTMCNQHEHHTPALGHLGVAAQATLRPLGPIMVPIIHSIGETIPTQNKK
jgi:hypothetical protein